MKPPENPRNHHPEECRRLLASLSDSIPSVRSFRGRWTAVSATLDRLRAALNEIAGLTGTDLSHQLLRSLSQTLTLILSLSTQCRLPEPAAGRLRTQSDLIAAAASLDQQADDAEFLIRTGDLVNPLPCNSRLEALRAEARTLVTRLQIGTLASRIPALDSLIAMLDGDEKNILIAIAQGLLPALLRLLDFAFLSNSEARDKVISALSIVSSVESCRPLLVAADETLLVSHLFRLLVEPDGCGSSKEKACATLLVLTLEKDIAMTVGSAPTICIILDICRSGTPPAAAAAAGILKNLSALPDIRLNLVQENCIPVMIRILQSGTILAQENAVSCLSNLAAGEENQSIKLTICQEGGLDCIRNYWEASSADNRDLQPAITLLRNLSSSNYFAGIILSAGFLPLMIQALDSASARTRTETAEAISGLVLASMKPDIERVKCAVPGLVRMLEAKGVEEKEVALKVLASLMTFDACRRLMRKDEKGILSIIMLLNPLVCNVQKKYSVAVLLAVARTRRCRNLVVASGARGFLPQLRSLRVEGAEKLSELLSKGKLLGVFPRS
ncbi:hypothetical protein KSP39_PZI023426 [Platanthera zijinensis]|uniref:DUF7032 domain-containing protein n=1 Tax=Platanthera zijinensis TaxID=2320716 RepID=A0AAP0FTX2_9ASPA